MAWAWMCVSVMSVVNCVSWCACCLTLRQWLIYIYLRTERSQRWACAVPVAGPGEIKGELKIKCRDWADYGSKRLKFRNVICKLNSCMCACAL